VLDHRELTKDFMVMKYGLLKHISASFDQHHVVKSTEFSRLLEILEVLF
jgi:hypothetical protein